VSLRQLLDNNRKWSSEMLAQDPQYFSRLAKQQSPQYLWIGCSDSRVPANEIVGLRPGEIFVHRNVGNLVVHSDLNCLTVLQYAVDVLEVRHVIVCGHYGCGGVIAAHDDLHLGVVDNWLEHVKDVRRLHDAELDALPDRAARLDRLCELNVIEQVVNVAHTTVVQDAWARGQALNVHGWIYGIQDGLIRDLGMSVSGAQELQSRYGDAVTIA